MSRLGYLVGLVACAAWAQGARIAVHPLEARELTVAQRAKLQGAFEVMTARVPGIRLAGGVRIDEALLEPEGNGCEKHDACLQYVAITTGSLYAVYARLQPDASGAELKLTGRVVRSDGELIQRVSLSAPLLRGVDLTDSGRELLTVLVKTLELDKLPAALPTSEVPQPIEDLAPPAQFATAEKFSDLEPPLVSAPSVIETKSAGLSPRRTAGFTLFGVGGGTLAVGGLLLGMASAERATLPVRDFESPEQFIRASNAGRQATVGVVLIASGAAGMIVGGLLAWLPEDRGVSVSVTPSGDGAGLAIAGRLP